MRNGRGEADLRAQRRDHEGSGVEHGAGAKRAPLTLSVASSAWLFRPRSWPLHWPRMAAVARGLAQSQTTASRSTVVACCTT